MLWTTATWFNAARKAGCELAIENGYSCQDSESDLMRVHLHVCIPTGCLGGRQLYMSTVEPPFCMQTEHGYPELNKFGSTCDMSHVHTRCFRWATA